MYTVQYGTIYGITFRADCMKELISGHISGHRTCTCIRVNFRTNARACIIAYARACIIAYVRACMMSGMFQGKRISVSMRLNILPSYFLNQSTPCGFKISR